MIIKDNTYKFFQKGLLVFSLTIFSSITFAQVYSNKEVGNKNAHVIDSIKKTEYRYSLPIWGKKVARLGYDLPYSAGIGINSFWQKSDLVLDNLSVGFNNGPMYDLDQVVRFNESFSEANAINVRPDIWLLPFLNVYGIFASSKPSTNVGFGIWVPDSSNNWKEVFSYNTKVNFTGTSVGFGFTPTIGVSGGWIALDMNFTWTDVSALDKPVFTYVFGPRLGKTFKLKNPERNIALWVGGFRVKYSSSTNGSILLNEVLPNGGNDAVEKIDAGQQKVSETQTQVDTWWNSLTSAQQNNPVNTAKYETANKALTVAGNILNAADGALTTITNSSVQYSLNKRVKDPWNFLVGAQFQLNKHWMVRAEYGFLGSRQQFLSGLQYRFGL